MPQVIASGDFPGHRARKENRRKQNKTRKGRPSWLGFTIGNTREERATKKEPWRAADSI